MVKIFNGTRPGVDKVKPKVWFNCKLTTRDRAGLFHHVLIYMGDLHFLH